MTPIKKRPKTKDQRPKTELVKAKDVKTGEVQSVPVYNSKGKEISRFVFDKKIFTGDVNKDLLYQAVRMYNANHREGNASTKTRGDVSGGGKKPWRQKGTGRARAGSTRSPLWRHGGIIFGPHPREFRYELPAKIRKGAFLSSINSKLAENKILGIDAVVIQEPKTKNFASIVDALKLKGKSLFVVDVIDENIMRATRNMDKVMVKDYKDFNTMDVLNSDNVVMSRMALEKLPERFKA